MMSSHTESLGAPGSTVINGGFELRQVTFVLQSVQTAGSEMLLLVDTAVNSEKHQFLVGGYWSTDGFRLTSMLELGKTASAGGNGFPQAIAVLYGVTFSDPSDVLKDRVQQAINQQDVGRPKRPSATSVQRQCVDGRAPSGIDGEPGAHA